MVKFPNQRYTIQAIKQEYAYVAANLDKESKLAATPEAHLFISIAAK